ncbi:hypothetical protein NFI96_026322 [Prochilodus magdalenae]|nr:hypothetical protein NFI96_026322 [Prochilodus magdalenae]
MMEDRIKTDASSGEGDTEPSMLLQKLKNNISKSVQNKVDTILASTQSFAIFSFVSPQRDVQQFSDNDKLYLYLQLPSGPSAGEKSLDVLGDLLTDLDQGITELLDSLKFNLVASEGPKMSQRCSIGFRLEEPVGHSMGYASPDHHRPTTKPVMLNDVAGSTTFSTASPEPVTSVTCAQLYIMESSGKGNKQAELSSVIAELQRVRRSIEELSQLQTRLNAKRTTLEAQQVSHPSSAGDRTAETAITSTSRNVAPGSWRKRLLARVAEVNIAPIPDSSASGRPRRQQRRCPPPAHAQPEVTTTTNRFKALSSLVLAPPSVEPVLRRRKNKAPVFGGPRHQKPRCSPPPHPEVTTTSNSLNMYPSTFLTPVVVTPVWSTQLTSYTPATGFEVTLRNTLTPAYPSKMFTRHIEMAVHLVQQNIRSFASWVRKHCENLQQRPLSAANFGKIIRDIFPNIKARRLGGRGHGIRRKTVLNMPLLPNLDLKNDPSELTELVQTYKQEVTEAACELICDWAQKILKRSFDTVVEIARFLVQEHIVNPRCSQAELVTSAALAGGPSKPHKVMKKITPTTRGTGAEDDSQDAKKDKDSTDQVSTGKQQLAEKQAKGSESSRSGGRDLQVEALMKMKKFPQILPRHSIPDKSSLSVHSSPPAFTTNDSSSVKVTLPITVTTLPAQQGLPVVILPSGMSLSYPEQEKSTSVTVSTSAAPTPVVQRARSAAPKRGPDPISTAPVTGPGNIPPKRKRGRPRKPRPEEMTPQPVATVSSLNPNPQLLTGGVIQKALSSSASTQSTQLVEFLVQDLQGTVVSQDVRDSEQTGVVVKCQNVLEPEAPPILLLHTDNQPGSEMSRAMVIQRAPISQPMTQSTSSAATLEENREVQDPPVEALPTSTDKTAPPEENPPPLPPPQGP